jgi:hypothetical protein
MSRFQDEQDDLYKALSKLDSSTNEHEYLINIARVTRANAELLILVTETLENHDIFADKKSE